MIISIPVSSFSKKIITKFTPEPVRIDARNVLAQQFGNIRTGEPFNAITAEQLLNDSLTIRITNKINKTKIPYLYQAGLNIHKLHLFQMMTFIESQVLAGKEASKAIAQFYKIHDLTNEDMNIETTFRKWQRHYSKKKPVFFSKNNIFNNTNSDLLERNVIDTIRISEIHDILSLIIFNNLQIFTTTNKKFRKKLFLHLKIYIYKIHLRYSTDKVAELFELSTRQINNIVVNIRDVIKYDRTLGPSISQYLS